jgi:hypothetical protein
MLFKNLTQMKNATGKPLLDELAAKNLKESLTRTFIKRK